MNADSTMADVLIIDGDIQIRRFLRMVLLEAGYQVREADSAAAGEREILRRNPCAVILELSLPDKPGLEVLEELRKWNPVPVLILSVFNQEKSKVAGLDAGADDYLVKPFGENELLARLRALLRRIKPAVATSRFCFGHVEVDVARHRVSKEGHPLKLTSMEYSLLQLFITHRDKVLTHRHILRELWGVKAQDHTHYLRTYMLRLRRKLEDDLDAPKYFQTESGIGYRFISEQTESS